MEARKLGPPEALAVFVVLHLCLEPAKRVHSENECQKSPVQGHQRVRPHDDAQCYKAGMPHVLQQVLHLTWLWPAVPAAVFIAPNLFNSSQLTEVRDDAASVYDSPADTMNDAKRPSERRILLDRPQGETVHGQPQQDQELQWHAAGQKVNDSRKSPTHAFQSSAHFWPAKGTVLKAELQCKANVPQYAHQGTCIDQEGNVTESSGLLHSMYTSFVKKTMPTGREGSHLACQSTSMQECLCCRLEAAHLTLQVHLATHCISKGYFYLVLALIQWTPSYKLFYWPLKYLFLGCGNHFLFNFLIIPLEQYIQGFSGTQCQNCRGPNDPKRQPWKFGTWFVTDSRGSTKRDLVSRGSM